MNELFGDGQPLVLDQQEKDLEGFSSERNLDAIAG